MRIGDVEIDNVEAVVVPAQLSQVLLGNTFLTRFQMKRENDTPLLDKWSSAFGVNGHIRIKKYQARGARARA